MRIGDHKITNDQLVVIAAPPEQATHAPGVVYWTPCDGCGRTLQIDADSVQTVAKGSPVSCLLCALRRWPDMIAGRDPDTGRPITLRQLCDQPNCIGGYRREDLKEI